jgi:hypothetical protein
LKSIMVGIRSRLHDTIMITLLLLCYPIQTKLILLCMLRGCYYVHIQLGTRNFSFVGIFPGIISFPTNDDDKIIKL